MIANNTLLVMVLKGLVRTEEEQDVHEANLITSLQLGQITWDEFMEAWESRHEVKAKVAS